MATPNNNASQPQLIPFLLIDRVYNLLFQGGKIPTPGFVPVPVSVTFPNNSPESAVVTLVDPQQSALAEQSSIFVGPWSGVEDLFPPATIDSVVSEFPSVKAVHIAQVGVEHVEKAKCLSEKRVSLSNARGSTAIPIAEFVLMFMLTKVKKTKQFYELPAPTPLSPTPNPYVPEPMETRTATDFWSQGKRLALSELFEKTVFILGLGKIGSEVARRCGAGFGMRVWGTKRTPEDVPHVDRVFTGDDWRTSEVLGQVDFLVISAPVNEGTREVVNAELLGMLKKGAYICNIGRGSLISVPALTAAIDSNHISGAALDVTDPDEPPSTYNPLWKYYPDKVWITPHQAWSSERTMERMMKMVLAEVERAHKGLAPVNPVT